MKSLILATVLFSGFAFAQVKVTKAMALPDDQVNIEKGIKQDEENDLKLAGCSMPSDESVIDCGDKIYLPTSNIRSRTYNDDLPDYCHSKKPEMKKLCKEYKNTDPSWRDASISGAELLAGLERQADEIMLSGCRMAADDKSITCGKKVYKIFQAVLNSSRNTIKSDSMDSPMERVDGDGKRRANKK